MSAKPKPTKSDFMEFWNHVKFIRTTIGLLFLLTFLLLPSKQLYASSITVSGNVSGQWNVDTVIVSANIELPWDQVLTIQPGCKVLFDGFYRFTVWGKLIALSDSLNPIRFERKDTTGYSQPNSNGAWEGIKNRLDFYGSICVGLLHIPVYEGKPRYQS